MKPTEIKAMLIEKAVHNLEGTILELLADVKTMLRGEGSTDEGGFAGTKGDYSAISQENSLREQAQINRSEALKHEALIKGLKTIDTKITHDFVCQGSLISTNHGHYFISQAVRPIKLNGESYFLLATDAPIYEVMAGKKIGDKFEFRGINYEIQSIS